MATAHAVYRFSLRLPDSLCAAVIAKRAACLFGTLALAASAVAIAQPSLDPQERAQAQDGVSVPEKTEAPPPEPGRRDASFSARLLDAPHDFLSRSVEAYSRRVDDFFSDPNRAYDSTGSTLQIRSHVTFFEGGYREGKSDVQASVSLPNTEDRFKLIVQRGVESATQTAAERDIKNATGSPQVTAPGAPQDTGYYLGLKALAAEVLGVALSAEAGAKFHWPLDPYVRFRAVRDISFPQWAIRLSETPLWKNSEGWSAASELDLHRPLDEAWQLRLTSKATWRSTTSYFDLAQIAALYYVPDKRTATVFELGAFAPSDRSVKLSVYAVTVRVRRLIYRDWLYLEITPQILYQEANGFSATRSLMLQLGMLFGDRYLQR